ADHCLESEAPEPVGNVRHPPRHDPQARREALLAGNGKCLQAEEDQVEERIADADDVDVHARPPTGPGRARVTTYNAISSDRARPGFRVGTSVPTMNQRQVAEEPVGAGRHDVHGDDLPSVQVLRRIEADILTGRLLSGSRLAPERELGARLGVARNTLRRALSTLADKGLIQARGRGGWVVVGAAVTERIEGPPSFTEWAARHGYVVTSNVIVARSRAATMGEASELRIVASSKVFELERVRFIEGVPISLDRSVLHPRLIPALKGVDFANRSLYGTVRERAGVIP